MEYEEKYKEALERARALRQEAIDKEYVIDYVKDYEAIFPELAESEDERMLRTIIRGFENWKGNGNVTFNNTKVDDILAYLEKQKINTEGDFGRGYGCGYQAGYAVAMNEMKPKVATATLDSEKQKESLRDFIDDFPYSDEQKEQKPEIRVKIPKFRVGDIIQRIPLEKWDSSKKIISIDECGYNYNLSHLGDTVSGGAIGFAFENEYELVEQKPVDLSEMMVHKEPYIAPVPTPMVADEHKPAEWSEKDENKIESIKGLITTGRFADTNTIRTIWELLDSLRPSWKPSEEQMEALKDAVRLFKENHFEKFHYKIESLYEQLKQL